MCLLSRESAGLVISTTFCAASVLLLETAAVAASVRWGSLWLSLLLLLLLLLPIWRCRWQAAGSHTGGPHAG